VRERESSNPTRQLRDLTPAFLLRREAVPTKGELVVWLADHLRLAAEPDQEDKIRIVDGMLTERRMARVYTRAQIERLRQNARPPFSVRLGTHVITFD
jgi:hypothetical protein